MTLSRQTRFIIILVMVTGTLLTGCAVVMLIRDNAPQTQSHLMRIERGNIENTVITTGTLQPIKKISVGAQVNGQLKKLYVKQGEKVKKDQLLAEIDPVIQQNELRKAQAELNSSQAQIRSSHVLLKQYELALTRQKRMARENSGVTGDLENAQAQYDTQREQLRMYEAQLVQSEISVETAKANLGYTRILAPIDGEVLGIITQEGQTIVSSQTAPTLMVLADMSIMRVQTRISETDILKTHTGQPVWFHVVADPKRRYESVMGILQDAPEEALHEASDNTGNKPQATAIYYNGEFNINNEQRRLKTSMTADVFITVGQAKNVLLIPLSAVGELTQPNRYKVRVMENDKIVDRQVQLGLRDLKFAEVKAGLAEGDRVLSLSPEWKGGA